MQRGWAWGDRESGGRGGDSGGGGNNDGGGRGETYGDSQIPLNAAHPSVHLLPRHHMNPLMMIRPPPRDASHGHHRRHVQEPRAGTSRRGPLPRNITPTFPISSSPSRHLRASGASRGLMTWRLMLRSLSASLTYMHISL